MGCKWKAHGWRLFYRPGTYVFVWFLSFFLAIFHPCTDHCFFLDTEKNNSERKKELFDTVTSRGGGEIWREMKGWGCTGRNESQEGRLWTFQKMGINKIVLAFFLFIYFFLDIWQKPISLFHVIFFTGRYSEREWKHIIPTPKSLPSYLHKTHNYLLCSARKFVISSPQKKKMLYRKSIMLSGTSTFIFLCEVWASCRTL